jgi:hypothetical protein
MLGRYSRVRAYQHVDWPDPQKHGVFSFGIVDSSKRYPLVEGDQQVKAVYATEGSRNFDYFQQAS